MSRNFVAFSTQPFVIFSQCVSRSIAMQRWWYSDDKNNGRDKLPKSKKSPIKRNDGIRKWKFCVFATCDMNKCEKVAVTGSCEQLGEWDPDQSVLLNKEDGEKFETLPKNMMLHFMFSPSETFLPLQKEKKDIFSHGARSVFVFVSLYLQRHLPRGCFHEKSFFTAFHVIAMRGKVLGNFLCPFRFYFFCQR